LFFMYYVPFCVITIISLCATLDQLANFAIEM
jgi:hypothetical protein